MKIKKKKNIEQKQRLKLKLKIEQSMKEIKNTKLRLNTKLI